MCCCIQMHYCRLSEIVQMMMMMEDDESQPKPEDEGGEGGKDELNSSQPRRGRTYDGLTVCSRLEVSCICCTSPPSYLTASASMFPL